MTFMNKNSKSFDKLEECWVVSLLGGQETTWVERIGGCMWGIDTSEFTFGALQPD